MALSGNTLAVGAYGDDGGSGSLHGAVYVFTRSGSTWSLQDEISNTDHSDNTGFDSTTLKSGDYFRLLGGLGRWTPWPSEPGATTATVGPPMSLPALTALWSLEDEISSTDHSDNTGFDDSSLSSSDYFGYSVALDGDTLAVGAYGG